MPNIAVVGATGAVGTEFLKIFTERQFPIQDLRLLASQRSQGKVITWQGRDIEVQESTASSFQGMDIVFFAGGSASTQFAPAAVQSGAVVIDNSSAFRMDPQVPLVIPEINPQDIQTHQGIIANPNCSTIIMAMALKPLEDLAGIERLVVSTYQAVSGAGKEGIAELEEQTQAWAAGRDVQKEVGKGAFPYPIAFNVIPRIDVFQEADYTKEEWKMVRETQKIFHRPDMRITATTVRVPVWRSHSESVNVQTRRKVSVAEARRAMAAFPGLVVQDVPSEDRYPMPLNAANRDEVFVGRLREDLSIDQGLNFWVVGDQIRKGAATNAVQIAERLL